MQTEITLGQVRLALAMPVNQNGLPVGVAPFEKLAQASLSSAMMFWIGNKIKPDLQKHFEDMELRRVELIKKHGFPIKDPAGEIIPERFDFTPEGREAFNAEFDELCAQVVTIDARTFTPEEFEKYESALALVKFNGNDMGALDWLIKEPEQAKTAAVENIADHQKAKEAAG